MIDVVFFLLVFFMMARSGHDHLPGLARSTCPRRRGRPAERRRDAPRSRCPRDGGSFLNREPDHGRDAERSGSGRSRRTDELAVIINADREVTHARVVDVLDELRQTGVGKIAIAVAPGAERQR